MGLIIGKAKLSRTVQTVGDLIAVLIGISPETRIRQGGAEGVTVTYWENALLNSEENSQWVDFEEVDDDDDWDDD